MKTIHLYESKHNERYAIKMHHHSNYQILYVIEGEGTIHLEGVQHQLESDCAAIVMPYADHAVASNSHLTLLVLEFDGLLFEDHAAAYWKQYFTGGSQILRLNLFHAGELRQLLRKLLFEEQQEYGLQEWAMRIYWLEVLLLLTRAQQASPVTDANGLRAERIREYIDSHYYQPLTAGDLAYKLGISSRHATNIFKEKYQITPMQYLADVRISIAKKLLAETQKDVISISFEVGYESLATFYRAFKNSALMSPSKYRQQYQQE